MRHNSRLRSAAVAPALALIGLGVAALPATSAGAADAPTVSVGDVVVYEGDTGAAVAKLTVTADTPMPSDTFVSFSTVDGSATAGGDYTARTARVRMRATKTTATITLKVAGDTAVEGDEAFSVAITSAGTATIGDGDGTVTIRDDDTTTGPRLAIGDAAAYEGNSGKTPLRFTVRLDAPAPTDVVARVTAVSGSAEVGTDTMTRSSTVRLRVGRLAAVVTVNALGDTDLEPDEQFAVVLSDVTGATIADGTGAGTVYDDDTPPFTTPGAPTLTGAVAGPANGMLAVNWTAPADNGNSPITGYELEIVRPTDTVVGTYTGLGANVVCGGAGATCTLRVRAVNAAGPGPWSDALSGTTWRAPGPVGNLTASGGNHVVQAFWDAPTDTGDFPLVDYRIERSDDRVNFTFVTTTTVRTASVSCGGERVTCWIRVIPRSSAGFGTPADASATTWARPGAPALVSIRRIGIEVGLGWTPPLDDGGTQIFDYRGERSVDGGATWTPVGSVQFTPPTCPVGVSCAFRVIAVNAVGQSDPSNVMTVGP